MNSALPSHPIQEDIKSGLRTATSSGIEVISIFPSLLVNSSMYRKVWGDNITYPIENNRDVKADMTNFVLSDTHRQASLAASCSLVEHGKTTEQEGRQLNAEDELLLALPTTIFHCLILKRFPTRNKSTVSPVSQSSMLSAVYTEYTR
jgi:hypothetical protein